MRTNGKIEVHVQTKTIEVAVADYGPNDHVSRHVDVQLDNAQAAALKRAAVGLDHGNYRLANGKRVTTNPDVVRYLLEQILGVGE